MGKFFDALKKSETFKRSSPVPPSKKVVKISTEKIEALRLGTTAPGPPAEQVRFFDAGIDPRLASLLEPSSPGAECFKLLRARLTVTSPDKSLKAIMVSSPQPLDGKTFVAANLAVAIAHGINEHVMLVDCDLRRPSMDRLLGLNARQGIREYLEKGSSVAPYLMKTPLKKLTLLPAGKPPSNPSELLSSEKMRLLVQELKNRYEDRYIIFDATPAQFTAETTFLASVVDGVLMVVRSGKTARDSILKAIKNIDRNKIVGVVFNASTESSKDYGYYYRYYRKGQK